MCEQASDSLYLFTGACGRNHLASPCNRSVASLLPGCAQAKVAGSPASQVVRQVYFVSENQGGKCGSGCSAQVAEMVFREGCCAATLASAEARWIADMTGNYALGSRFRVDWGGGRVEEFRAAVTCSSASSIGRADVRANGVWVDAACRGQQCTANGEVWPAACCDAAAAACANGGRQGESGSCVCACTDGWTGRQCVTRTPHVRLGLLLIDTTRRIWVLGAAYRIRAILANYITVERAAIEIDGVPQESGFGSAAGSVGDGRRGQGTALRVEMRVLADSNDEALRIKKAVGQLVSTQVCFPCMLCILCWVNSC